jgi:hypothetical protein
MNFGHFVTLPPWADPLFSERQQVMSSAVFLQHRFSAVENSIAETAMILEHLAVSDNNLPC